MSPDLFNYSQPQKPLAGQGSEVILHGLDQTEWDTFAGFAERLQFAAGAPIVRAGEVGRAIYIVQSGQIRGEIMVGGKARPTSVLSAGAVFGELAFFDAAPRSATLWAVGDVQLLVLSFAAFEKLAAWHPRIARELLLDLGRVLAMRLRRTEAQG